VLVADAKTGEPLAGASVTVAGAGGERSLTGDATGHAVAKDLPPGEVVARVAAAGYLPAEGRATIAVGRDVSLEVRASPEPPKFGGLAITVKDKESGAPLAGAKVIVRGVEHASDEAGRVAVSELPLGPAPIAVALEGYRPAKEVGSVVGGVESPVAIALLKEAAKPLATITGLVRSKRGGKPISADLEIPGVKVRTRADARGAFAFKVAGGTYQVNISAPGYVAQSKTVTVKDGDEAIFNVDLYPQ
jgi:hypothetical protein